jgi:hypothetical protein
MSLESNESVALRKIVPVLSSVEQGTNSTVLGPLGGATRQNTLFILAVTYIHSYIFDDACSHFCISRIMQCRQLNLLNFPAFFIDANRDNI